MKEKAKKERNGKRVQRWVAGTMVLVLGLSGGGTWEHNVKASQSMPLGITKEEDGSYAYEAAELNDNGTSDDSSDDYYEIANAGHLYWFAEKVNNGENTINGKVTKDIVVNPTVLTENGSLVEDTLLSWNPIGKGISEAGSYQGVFDGNGKTISGLYIKDEYAQGIGLFGTVQGTVKNVGVVDSYFWGNSRVGGICGQNSGIITQCHNRGIVIASVNNIEEGGCVGGICGKNTGIVTSCYNTGEVTGKEKTMEIGGICGYSDAEISNCYNTGKITGGQAICNLGGICGYAKKILKNCYNTGTLWAGTNAQNTGAIFGGMQNQKFSNCYYLRTVFSWNVAVGENVNANMVSEEDFASKKIAYLLDTEAGTTSQQNVWGQDVETGMPKQCCFGGEKVYKFSYKGLNATSYTEVLVTENTDIETILPDLSTEYYWIYDKETDGHTTGEVFGGVLDGDTQISVQTNSMEIDTERASTFYYSYNDVVNTIDLADYVKNVEEIGGIVSCTLKTNNSLPAFFTQNGTELVANDTTITEDVSFSYIIKGKNGKTGQITLHFYVKTGTITIGFNKKEQIVAFTGDTPAIEAPDVVIGKDVPYAGQIMYCYRNADAAETAGWLNSLPKLPGIYTIKASIDTQDGTKSDTMTLTITKGDIPSNVPEERMVVPYSVEKVTNSLIEDNNNWSFSASDINQILTPGVEKKVMVEYTGTDKKYYNTITKTITILRQECEHITTVKNGVVESSCKQEGYTGNLVCESCKKVLEAGTKIDKKAHVWDKGVVTKEATETEDGLKTFTCLDCSETKQELISKLSQTNTPPDTTKETENPVKTPDTSKETESPVKTPDTTKETKKPAEAPEITKVPEIPEKTPGNTITSKEPESSQMPNGTKVPVVYPDATDTSGDLTEATKAPQNNELLEVTEVPLFSEDPSETFKPDTKETPVVSSLPDSTKIPVQYETPDVLSTPDAGADIHQTAVPDFTQVPVAKETPTVSEEVKKESGTSSTAMGITTVYPSKTETTIENENTKVIALKKGAVFEHKKTNAKYKVVNTGKTPKVQFITTLKQKHKITIPDTVQVYGIVYSVVSIKKNACKGNKKVKKIVIGSNVSTIGAKAFLGCKKISEIIFETSGLTVKQIGKNAFSIKKGKVKIFVPKEKKSQYTKIMKMFTIR